MYHGNKPARKSFGALMEWLTQLVPQHSAVTDEKETRMRRDYNTESSPTKSEKTRVRSVAATNDLFRKERERLEQKAGISFVRADIINGQVKAGLEKPQ
jgi:hypothetical protein